MQPSTTKRKAHDDTNPLVAAAKRAKKEQTKSSASNKRKLLNGEELPGGLVIVRAPPAPQGHRPNVTPQQSSSPPSPQPALRPAAGQSYPPNKKFRADTASRTASRANNDRDALPRVRGEPEVDEDVRRMDSEADDLRRYSRESISSPAALKPEFAFPATLSQQHDKLRQKKQKQSAKVLQGSSDGSSARERETARVPRESLHQRRSSMGLRGKRISASFEATGIIAQPHNSVSDTSFYKHIDPDLPPAARVRQLLIWCSSRAAANAASDSAAEPSTAKKRKGRKSAKEKQPDKGPPLSDKASQVLRGVQDQVIRMLAERKIDTGVFGGPGGAKEKIKENAQNVRNRQCKARFTAQIERAEAEDLAWAETDRFYAARLAELAEMAQPSSSMSAKAKGKRRVESEDLPRLDELPERFRSGANMALHVVAEGLSDKTTLAQQFERLQFELDDLHAFANTALRCTDTAESELDFRFALLSVSLAGRSAAYTMATSASLPVMGQVASASETTRRDPLELLRALADVDAERPPALVGDSARRAVREVQRVNENGGSERRLTGVSPPAMTPRKPLGTPRKTTPGRKS